MKKETLAQVFSCEFCKIFKNTFSYRTPPVTASVNKFLSNEKAPIIPPALVTGELISDFKQICSTTILRLNVILLVIKLKRY